LRVVGDANRSDVAVNLGPVVREIIFFIS
jgi:hypothetical protein